MGCPDSAGEQLMVYIVYLIAVFALAWVLVDALLFEIKLRKWRKELDAQTAREVKRWEAQLAAYQENWREIFGRQKD